MHAGAQPVAQTATSCQRLRGQLIVQMQPAQCWKASCCTARALWSSHTRSSSSNRRPTTSVQCKRLASRGYRTTLIHQMNRLVGRGSCWGTATTNSEHVAPPCLLQHIVPHLRPFAQHCSDLPCGRPARYDAMTGRTCQICSCCASNFACRL
jgi:hypothetical protein